MWYCVVLFFTLGYIVVPFFYTFKQAFSTEDGMGWQNFWALFSNPNQIEIIRNTLVLGIASVFTCGLLGTALAFYMTFWAGKWKKIVHVLLLSPMMVPGVIIVIAFLQLYAESGILTKGMERLVGTALFGGEFQGFGAVLFVITYTQYVYFYLNVYVGLKYVDYSAIEAARSMGASYFRVLKDVIRPTIAPAVFTSVVITFAGGVSAFSAPNLIGGGFKVLSTQIVRLKANNYMEMASAQVIVLFGISVTFLLMTQLYGEKYKSYQWERAVTKPPAFKRRKWMNWILLIPIVFSLVMVLLPVAGIFYLSFMENRSIMTEIFPKDFTWDNYIAIFSKERTLQPFINSIQMSCMAVGMGLVVTTPGAWFFSKSKGNISKLLSLLLMIPWTMPASVIGINLMNGFSRGNIFSFFQPLIGGYYILPIAYTITLIPVLLTTAEAGIKNFNPVLQDAAKSLGASGVQSTVHVILPNIAPGIIAGGILAFIRTLGEYTISALLYGIHNRPISISMVTNMQEYEIGISLAYGVLVILLCSFALGSVLMLDKRRFF